MCTSEFEIDVYIRSCITSIHKNFTPLYISDPELHVYIRTKDEQSYAMFAGSGGVVGAGHKVRTYKEYHSVCPSSELGLPPNPPPQG